MLEMLEEIDNIASREPRATKARQEIGEVETTALGGGGGTWLKAKNVTIIGGSFTFREKSRANQKKLCQSVAQAENHEKGPRWSWAGNDMGNVNRYE
jgi:hypothetical protein